jgi:hypothetical protein
LQPFNLVYGVPIIVGAKKNLPNFNEFAMENTFSITRKLEVTRGTTNDPITSYKINQMFNCSVLSQLGVECWNSYITNYTRPTTIWISDKLQMTLTNDETQQPWYSLDTYLDATMSTNYWVGGGLNFNPASFLTNDLTAILLPTASYVFQNTPPNVPSPPFLPFFIAPTNNAFETNVNLSNASSPRFPQPHWGLTTTNNVQVVLIDDLSGRAIDYVQLRGPSGTRDLTSEILNSSSTNYSTFWLTNIVTSSLTRLTMPSGVDHQLTDSEIPFEKNAMLWKGQNQYLVDQQVAGFLNFFRLTHTTNSFGSTNLWIDAPYTPTAISVQYISWQANDPIVHYLASDLTYSGSDNDLETGITEWTPYNLPPSSPPNIGQVNTRYEPWGDSGPNTKATANVTSADQNHFNFSYKDAGVTNSDAWDFLSGKLPTVGWIGRIHRGTPWQTVFLKATNVMSINQVENGKYHAYGANTWTNWTGNINSYDASNTIPAWDRLLFDIFTSAINDNSTRGQLSVNVEAEKTNDSMAGIAAWSALFSGMVVPTSLTNTYTIIQPAGITNSTSTLGQIVTSINYFRSHFQNVDGLVGAFEHSGDILATPQLTEQSPYLIGQDFTNGVNDQLMEWLPQQMMGLVRASSSPGYVIYCYGQALRPAQDGQLVSGPYSGMVTNYQVMAESALRVVITVETNQSTQARQIIVKSYNLLPPD